MIEAQKAFHTAAAECFARKQRGELQTLRERALCVNQAQLAIVGPIEPNGDLLAQETAYRLVLADEIDRKAITRDEANLKFVQFRSGLTAEANRRDAVQSQINSQNVVAAALLMNASRPTPLTLPQLGGPTPVTVSPSVSAPAPLPSDYSAGIRPLYTPPPLTPPPAQQVIRCNDTASGVRCY